MRVRLVAIRRARSRMACAGTPHMGRHPFRVLGLTVPLAREVAAEGFEPGAVFVEERLVVEAFMDQRMCQTQHQGGVGIRVRHQPFRLEEIRGVRPLPG